MNPYPKGLSMQIIFAILTSLTLLPSVYLATKFYQNEPFDYGLLIVALGLHTIFNLTFALYFIKNKILSDKNVSFLNFGLLFNLIFLIPIFPLSATTYTFNPGRVIATIRHTVKNSQKLPDIVLHLILLLAKKLSYFIFLLLFIFPLWIVLYLEAGNYLRNEYILNRDSISVVGTGSMYPTFPKGTGKTDKELSSQVVATPGMSRFPTGFSILGLRLFDYTLGRGDIVAFTNSKVTEIVKEDELNGNGFIKRIIGLPGDKIELRDGNVLLNGSSLKEPYTARARSTFGGDTLEECKVMEIPDHKLFVMGDNRKSSHDSRFKLGLIDIKDVDHVIPFYKQKGSLDKNYRDTSKDSDASSKIHIDKINYVKLLNEKRREIGLKPLTYNKSLEDTAYERGMLMYKKQNLNPNTSDGPDSMKSILESRNLSTILIGEAAVKGYYDDSELIENQFEFSATKKFLTNKDFNEIGIAEVEGLISDCPAQVIVSHLSGYIPPVYTKDQIESILKSVNNIKETRSSWEKAKKDPLFYKENKEELDRIFVILDIQLENYESIKNAMLKTQWLSKEQEKFVDETSKELSKERDDLMEKINKRIKEMTFNRAL